MMSILFQTAVLKLFCVLLRPESPYKVAGRYSKRAYLYSLMSLASIRCRDTMKQPCMVARNGPSQIFCVKMLQTLLRCEK